VNIKYLVTLCLAIFLLLASGVVVVTKAAPIISSLSSSFATGEREDDGEKENEIEGDDDGNTTQQTTINQDGTPSGTGSGSDTTQTPATTQCLITVDGTVYDVQTFKNQHSGGNIFNCGTDMSAVFHQQHNQRYLTMMQLYIVP
jgi:hypothetical protein